MLEIDLQVQSSLGPLCAPTSYIVTALEVHIVNSGIMAIGGVKETIRILYTVVIFPFEVFRTYGEISF